MDRNQLGDSCVVYFERRGPRILLVQPNLSYRATSDNSKEQASVHDAFAQSILWGFKVEAQKEGSILVDMTEFLLRDAHGVSTRLKSGDQGNYSLDDSRSALYPAGTMNFPENTEFEATLTFSGDAQGGNIRSVTPTADAVTVRQHHSFVQLPDDSYKPRTFDPLGAAETAANLTAGMLFNANRAARLVDFQARNDDNLGLGEMIDQVLGATWKAEHASQYKTAVQRTVDFVVLYNIIQLTMDDNASNQLRAIVHSKLKDLKSWLEGEFLDSGDESWQVAYDYGFKMIDDYENHPVRIKEITPPLDPPPGSPIGSGAAFLECGL